MRVPLQENISSKKQHARASVVKHIRQEAEATFCVDSWLRAFRACECPFRKTDQARSSMRVPLW